MWLWRVLECVVVCCLARGSSFTSRRGYSLRDTQHTHSTTYSYLANVSYIDLKGSQGVVLADSIANAPLHLLTLPAFALPSIWWPT